MVGGYWSFVHGSEDETMRVGSRVRREGGGPLMVVVSRDGDRVRCRILEPDEGRYVTFDRGQLVLVDEPEDEPDSGAGPSL